MKARPYIFWALLAAMFAYELYAILSPSPGDTISEITWSMTTAAPIITFLFGVLCGHFFWSRNQCSRPHIGD